MVRIRDGFIAIRFIVIPRKNIVDVSYGILIMRTKGGTVTHTCLDIKAADGAIYKYTSRKKDAWIRLGQS